MFPPKKTVPPVKGKKKFPPKKKAAMSPQMAAIGNQMMKKPC